MTSSAVTGWAWRTPLGSDVESVCDRLLLGDTATGPNPLFDASAFRVTTAAAIPDAPKKSKHRRFLDRVGLLALEVAIEALEHAGEIPRMRLGLFCGVGGLRICWSDMMIAFGNQRDDGVGAWNGGLKNLHPFLMLKHLSNNAHALLAADIHAKGEGVTFGGATAGAQAIGAAVRAIEAGAVDAALVVAYDSLLDPESLLALGEAGASFIPGEAAAAIVLEPLDTKRPQARVRARVNAFATGDGQDGEPGAETIDRAVAAVRGGSEPILRSTEAAMGRVGAADALVQTIALANVLGRGQLPPCSGDGWRRACHERAAVAIGTGAPGLAAAVRVEAA